MPYQVHEIPARAWRTARISEIRTVRMDNADAGGEDGAPREIEISFSSDTEVERWGMIEILGHEAGEVRLDFLRSGSAPFLRDHRQSIENTIGHVTAASIEGGRGLATVRMHETPEAREIADRIQRGELGNISVGYAIHAWRLAEERDGVRVYRVTDWEPREVSLVAVPADASVGVGRAGEDPRGMVRAANMEGSNMPEREQEAAPAVAAPEGQDTRTAAEMVAAERERIARIHQIGARHQVGPDVIGRAVTSGRSVEAFQGEVLDIVGDRDFSERQTAAHQTGLTDQEARRFNVLNLVRHMRQPHDAGLRAAAAFEIEASEAAARHYGGSNSGDGRVIPEEVFRRALGRRSAALAARSLQVRAMQTGVAADGGALVATDLDGDLIDVLRATTVLVGAGGRVIRGLVADLDLPRKTAGSAIVAKAETAQAVLTNPTLDIVSLRPHQLSAPVEITMQMQMQSAIDVSDLIMSDIIDGMTVEVDRQGLAGDGTGNTAVGILNTAGIGSSSYAGAVPTWAEITAQWGALASANAAQGSIAWVEGPGEAGALMAVDKAGGGSGRFILEDGRIGMDPNFYTSNMPAGEHLIGNFADHITAFWGGGFIIMEDDTFDVRKGSAAIAGHALFDAQPRRPQSFVAGSGP